MSETSELLSAAEVAELTGKQRHKAQRRALAKMGIRHAVRPDGSPVVARAHFNHVLVQPRSSELPPAVSGGALNLDALHPLRRRSK